MPLPDLAATFAKVQEGVKKEIAEKSKYLREKDEGWTELLAAAGKRYASGDMKSKLDEAIESTIGDRLDLPLMLQWWHAKEGPAFAVRAWAHTWRWDPWGHAFENPGETIYKYGHNSASEYLHVREWVATLDAASYAEARDAAKAIHDVAPLTLRCGLACAFPEESSWAEKDADEILALDRAASHPVFNRPGFLTGVLASLRDETRISALAKQLQKDPWEARQIAETLARSAGDAAIDALARFADGGGGGRGDTVTDFAKGIAIVASPRAAAALAARLDDKSVRPVALELFSSRVDLAVPALAKVSSGRGKAADAAGRVAVQLASANRAAFDGAVAKLDASDKKAIAAVLDKLAVGPEASVAELPPVLRDPPWLRASRKAAPPPASVALTPLAIEEKVVWIPGELGEYDTPLPRTTPLIDVQSLVGWKNLPAGVKERSKEMDAFVEKAFAKSNPDEYFKRVHYVSTMLHVCSDAVALRLLDTQTDRLVDANIHDLDYLLSRFELRALGGLIALAEAQPARLAVLVRVASPKLAPLMADAHFRMKKIGPIARDWFGRFPEHAAVGLIPLALGDDKKLRAAATSAVRWMSQHGHAAVLRSVADRYGKPARAALDALLEFDPLDDFPAKLPKPPAWLKADAHPRPVLRAGRKSLPLAAVEHLLTMLQFPATDPPYAGFAQVKEACDPESLAELAWSLFNEWLLAGASGKEDWALAALGHLGTDETARRLGPKIRVWPGEAAHARAVKGLDVLAQIGTDVALMHLDGIATKLKFKGLQEKAKEKIAEVAESRGLSREELADRLVPDLDLDDDGSKVLDFGPRSFRVAFDEHLQPFVTDEAGKRQKDLPKPGKSDDAAKSAEATAWWKATKKDAKTLAAQQILRLELAMCARRTWDVPTFRTFMLEHPLVFHLVRRLVWGTYQNGKLGATFRVAEDKSFADDADRPFSLAEDATIGIPHLLDLGDAAAAAWGERLADYEIIQPFAQLQRPVYRVDAKEKTATALERFEGVKVPLGKVLRLEERGWRRGTPQDAGWIWDMEKPLPDGIVATLGLGDGILAGDMSESAPEQTLKEVTLSKRGSDGALALGDLAPLVFSELVRDLEELRGG